MNEILFLIPYHLTRPYFADLRDACEGDIYARFGDEYRVVPRSVPRESKEFDERVVLNILEREFRQSDRIGLLVVTATRSLPLTCTVARMAQQRNIPVIALSLPFQFPNEFKNCDRPVPPAVYCDGWAGASLLATAAITDFRKRWPKSNTPHVVLVPGETGRLDSDERIASFEQTLRDWRLDPVVTPLLDCHWQRDEACERMSAHLKGSKHPVQIVFAANDEMALGARDALLARKSPHAANCLVYGYDAVSEVRSLIAEQDIHMRGTVEQNVAGMARSLTELIPRVLAAPTAEHPDIRVAPVAVLPPAGAPDTLAELLAQYKIAGEWIWVTTLAAAKHSGYPVDTLKSYRSGINPQHNDDDYEYFRDKSGRIWRKDKKRQSRDVYYLRESLPKLPKKSATPPTGEGD